MPRSLPFRFTLCLHATPASGARVASSGPSGSTQPAPLGIDDLPVEESEAIARGIVEWIEGIEAQARTGGGVPWSHQFTGSGDSEAQCQEDAITQFYAALDPLCKHLAQPHLLAKDIEIHRPLAAVWIQITMLIHIIVSGFRDAQGLPVIWEVPFASASSGQVWIRVSVALLIRVQPA